MRDCCVAGKGHTRLFRDRDHPTADDRHQRLRPLRRLPPDCRLNRRIECRACAIRMGSVARRAHRRRHAVAEDDTALWPCHWQSPDASCGPGKKTRGFLSGHTAGLMAVILSLDRQRNPVMPPEPDHENQLCTRLNPRPEPRPAGGCAPGRRVWEGVRGSCQRIGGGPPRACDGRGTQSRGRCPRCVAAGSSWVDRSGTPSPGPPSMNGMTSICKASTK